jgi:cytidylate kinase
LILLAGPLYSGKSTLARLLADRCAFDVVAGREVLRAIATEPLETRHSLQRFGAALEASTSGAWLADAVRREAPKQRRVVVDAVRTVAQVAKFNTIWPETRLVYLDGSLEERRRRFDRARDPADHGEPRSFLELDSDSSERERSELRRRANVLVDTSDLAPEGVLREVKEALGTDASCTRE